MPATSLHKNVPKDSQDETVIGSQGTNLLLNYLLMVDSVIGKVMHFKALKIQGKS